MTSRPVITGEVTTATVRLLAVISAVGLVWTALMGFFDPITATSRWLTACLLTYSLCATLGATQCHRLRPQATNAAIAGLLLLDSLAVLTGVRFGAVDGWDLAYLPILVVAAGALHTARIWFGVTLAGIGAQYTAITMWVDSQWRGWTTTLLLALLISIIVFVSRTKTLDAYDKTLTQVNNEAVKDELTQLYNRRGVLTVGERMLTHATNTGGSLTVFFADVEHLKPVNDQYGHDAGDALLQGVSAALVECLRDGDCIGRWGGDEFVVISANSKMPPHVLAARLTDYLLNHPPVTASWWRPAVTIGQATFHAGERVTLEDIIERADIDMYTTRAYDRHDPTLIRRGNDHTS